MFQSLGLDPAIDFTTLETLGNTGSAALPITMALGIEQGCLQRGGNHIAMLGIGSGINCLMLAAEWQQRSVAVDQAFQHPNVTHSASASGQFP
jgi:3-oxoacyl-[acyl-carrier-protein] synthase-3